MKVAAFYHFLDLANVRAFRDDLQAFCDERDVLGTILVAGEGFNGTICGPEEAILEVFGWIEQRLGLDTPVEARWSDADEAPFRRMRVRIKKEIVTLGRPDILPHRKTGTYVPPEKWNALIENPEVLVIDTRNHYEVEVGTFPRAVDPGTDSFRQFPEFAQQLADTSKDRPLAMFCTGGIRCEKSTNWLLQQGVPEVFHLKGGILKYLEEMPEEQSLWEGECFVFDGRVSVGHGLKEGPHHLCHACRRPVLPADMERTEWEEGVSCHHCIGETSDADKTRFRERQKQIALAKARGERHLAGED